VEEQQQSSAPGQNIQRATSFMQPMPFSLYIRLHVAGN